MYPLRAGAAQSAITHRCVRIARGQTARRGAGERESGPPLSADRHESDMERSDRASVNEGNAINSVQLQMRGSSLSERASLYVTRGFTLYVTLASPRRVLSSPPGKTTLSRNRIGNLLEKKRNTTLAIFGRGPRRRSGEKKNGRREAKRSGPRSVSQMTAGRLANSPKHLAAIRARPEVSPYSARDEACCSWSA